MVRLELGGRAGEVSAGSEHPPHVNEQRSGPTDVLEHLLAVDEVKALWLERDRAAVERLEVGVGAGGTLVWLWQVKANPLDPCIARSEEIDRVPGSASQVQHPPRPTVPPSDLTVDVVLGDSLPCVVGRHDGPQQLLELAPREPPAAAP